MLGHELYEYARILERYERLENELIKLAGCNLESIIGKLALGYTLEPPVPRVSSMAELAALLKKEKEE